MIKYILTIIVVVIVTATYFTYQFQNKINSAEPVVSVSTTTAPAQEPVLIASAVYICDTDLSINASYYDLPNAALPASDAMPVPTGYVTLTLPEARTLSLNQTISASGVRYANADESIVFFNKGTGIQFSETVVTPDKFTNCIQVAAETATQTNIYHDGTLGYTLRYPETFIVDTEHAYAIGGTKTIPGVSFTIPDSVATGTNLSNDTYIAVESAKLGDDGSCLADRFLLSAATSTEMTFDGGPTYMVATSTDAGAGNRFEETVYARATKTECLILRSVIHYSVFENYPAGTIEEFDRESLTTSFDEIRNSLTTL